LSLSFENGKTYKYSYETTIHLNELSPPGETPKKYVGYLLTADVDITPVFQAGDTQLIKLQVKSHYPKGDLLLSVFNQNLLPSHLQVFISNRTCNIFVKHIS